MKQILQCQHSSTCSACPLIGVNYEDQLEQKKQHLLSLLKSKDLLNADLQSIDVLSAGDHGVRDRVDLTYDSKESSRLGFYGKDREIFHIHHCPQMSEALNEYFQQVSQISFPIKKGSLRLRVSPKKELGVWLDFSNQDTKFLLDEKHTLLKLLDLGIVEIGQKKKRLILQDTQLKLQKEPVFHPWFETYSPKNIYALQCTIGSFTQPGLAMNKLLLQAVFKMLKLSSGQRILEWGAGIGNFTIPLSEQYQVTALELDHLASRALLSSLEKINNEKTKIITGNFHKEAELSLVKEHDVFLCDPPRSGLQSYLDNWNEIPLTQKPKDFIYVSCSPESFVWDSQKLQQWGYSLQQITLVDQFPQSHHYEIIAHLSLSHS